jgi:hypothetical protein
MALLYHGIVVRISFKVSELLSAIVPSSRLSPCLSLEAGNLRCCRQHEHLKVIRNFKRLPLGQHRPEIELQDRRITHAVSGNITVRCRAPTYTTSHHSTPPHATTRHHTPWRRPRFPTTAVNHPASSRCLVSSGTRFTTFSTSMKRN